MHRFYDTCKNVNGKLGKFVKEIIAETVIRPITN